MPPKNTIYRAPYQIISFRRFNQLVRLGQPFAGNLEGVGYIVASRSGKYGVVDVITVYHDTVRIGRIKLSVEVGIEEVYSLLTGGQTIPSSPSHFEQLMARNQEQSATNPFRTAGQFAGLAGTFASGASMINKQVVIGSKYIRINPQGTVIRNANRNFTSVKNISNSAAKRIFVLGVAVDIMAVGFKEQTWKEALGSILINGAIYVLGIASAPLGVVAGASYLMFSGEGYRGDSGIEEDYSQRDNTQYVVPQKLPPQEHNPNSYYRYNIYKKNKQ